MWARRPASMLVAFAPAALRIVFTSAIFDLQRKMLGAEKISTFRIVVNIGVRGACFKSILPETCFNVSDYLTQCYMRHVFGASQKGRAASRFAAWRVSSTSFLSRIIHCGKGAAAAPNVIKVPQRGGRAWRRGIAAALFNMCHGISVLNGF